MKEDVFLTAEDVAKILGRSKAYAYKIIKEMNTELEAKGYRVVNGKVVLKFFNDKYFGSK